MSQPDDPVPTSSRVAKPVAKAPAAELSREDRLKAALKANMARRKAQARARAAQDDNEKE
ncbi:hypothetical protein D2N39_06415 [Gemmobacter lutimaris]|uniref:Uncharacterized protein n=1 Tax=Gemmobacter lutimaris TaxID=2306023 RepID=A0A398C1L0_9RHOB|nr:hypothetical protein [Gemmobacter lutimaris]RID93266.1 hypothetical protein D2N39_06415 [Gemmobacter lutimaris]